MKPEQPSALELAHLAARFVDPEKPETVGRAVSTAIRLWDACTFAVNTPVCNAYATNYTAPLANWIKRNEARETAEKAISELPGWREEWDSMNPGAELLNAQIAALFPRHKTKERNAPFRRLILVATETSDAAKADRVFRELQKAGKIDRNHFRSLTYYLSSVKSVVRSEAGKKGGRKRNAQGQLVESKNPVTRARAEKRAKKKAVK
jgi:hypothetical protein